MTKKLKKNTCAVAGPPISNFQNIIKHHRMALKSKKYHHSTQNLKLHRNVFSDFFRKKKHLFT